MNIYPIKSGVVQMEETRDSKKNLFTNTDHAIVRSAVKRLPGLLSIVVELRFWKQLTIAEIAEELGVSIRAVEISLTKAFKMLREECLRHPTFSRSKYHLIEQLRAMQVA